MAGASRSAGDTCCEAPAISTSMEDSDDPDPDERGHDPRHLER